LRDGRVEGCNFTSQRGFSEKAAPVRLHRKREGTISLRISKSLNACRPGSGELFSGSYV
jgi:hypothetical protein